MKEKEFNTEEYKEYISSNPGTGYLNIRAYAANSAIPIEGLDVKVYKVIDDERVVFYEGKTNNSGIISQIELPAPLINSNDEIAPSFQEYTVEATYNGNKLSFITRIFNGIQVLQNINVVPNIRLDGSMYGS